MPYLNALDLGNLQQKSAWAICRFCSSYSDFLARICIHNIKQLLMRINKMGLLNETKQMNDTSLDDSCITDIEVMA